MSEHELIVKKFHGAIVNIEFFGEEMYFDISGVASKFGKKLSRWENLDATKEYIDKLSDGYAIVTELLPELIIRKGNSAYLHRSIFVNFARWVNVEFSVWADRVIWDVLTGEKVLCEKERDHFEKTLESKDRTIKKLKEHIYAKPRKGDFQVVDRIRQDYKIQCSTKMLNELLVREGYMVEEEVVKMQYFSNSPYVQNGKVPTVYTQKLLDLVDEENIARDIGPEDIAPRLL